MNDQPQFSGVGHFIRSRTDPWRRWRSAWGLGGFFLQIKANPLLAGPDGGAWIDAARALQLPLACVRIGIDVMDPSDWWTSVAAMRPAGALLVRPDQHVAFRSQSVVADPKTTLQQVIAATLGEISARV